MSLEFWVNAERFYEFWLGLLGIIFLIGLISMIFVTSYAKRRNKKKVNATVFILSLSALLIGFLGHLYYKPYLEQASYVSPQNRDRRPRLLTYEYFLKSEQQAYQQINNLESLRKFTLYEEEPITESLTYLGEDEYFHYFQRSNGDYFKQDRQVEFSEEVKEAQLNGSQFSLKDEGFQEIGFKNIGRTMFDNIQIQLNKEGNRYEPENPAEIPRATDGIGWWNF